MPARSQAGFIFTTLIIYFPKNDEKAIILSKELIHDISAGRKLNCTRMGFAWMNLKKAERAIQVLDETIKR